MPETNMTSKIINLLYFNKIFLEKEKNRWKNKIKFKPDQVSEGKKGLH